jgi:hypothetical protein
MSSKVSWVVGLSLLSAACQADLTSPEHAPSAAMSVDDAAAFGASPVDLSGLWSWEDADLISYMPEVGQSFGMPVEGPVTHMYCTGSGTMELVQTGTESSGTSTLEAASCETNGGIVFVPPPEFAGTVSFITDGRIEGLNIQLTKGFGPIFGAYHGTVSEVEDDVATGLRITGRTIIPGHPKSPLPLDPPPAATSKTVAWVAVRPS